MLEKENERWSSHERERSYETKESREAEENQELKAAAAMERADFLSKEVKSSKQQMQNIVLHMQEVLAAIQELRKQLDLLGDVSVPSLEQDRQHMESLKKKIEAYSSELVAMKDDLIREQAVSFIKQGRCSSREESDALAKKVVEEMIEKIVSHKP